MEKFNKKFSEISEEEYNNLVAEFNSLNLEKLKLTRKLRVTENFLRNVQAGITAQYYFNEQMSKQKEDQERFTKLLLENWADIVLVFDKNLCFVLGTDYILSHIGINTNKIRGIGFKKIFESAADKNWVDATDKKIREAYEHGSKLFYDERIKFANSLDYRHYEAGIIPFRDNQGESMGVMFILHDTTDLVNAKIAAENANRAKSLFLANMSHEIRTPMFAIMGLNELIGKEPLSERQRNYLDNVKKSSSMLLTIINDILDFSRIEADRLEIVNSVFNLHELIENLSVMMTDSVTAKNLKFDSRISKNAPRFIEADENRLKQILINLLNNAVKYTSNGKISFSVSCRKNRLHFEVSDTGIGIKPQDIGRLFLPFEQLDLMKNKNITGAGLGLAITKKLCALMGGEISVKSKYGKGTTFTVTFPISCARDEPEKDKSGEGVNFLAENAKVLVVDDIVINLTIVEVQLNECGITPMLVTNGKQAVEAVKAVDFDLIIMDQMMPEMDGIEATALIRKMGGKYARIPIIALTANAVGDAREKLLSSGFDDFLAKPVEPAVLKSCLLKWLPPEKVKKI